MQKSEMAWGVFVRKSLRFVHGFSGRKEARDYCAKLNRLKGMPTLVLRRISVTIKPSKFYGK